jgi:hypothetical protein
MAELVTGLVTVIFHGAKEILAIISNIAAIYSAFMAIIGLLQLISSQGVLSGTLSWLIIGAITSAITGAIAEVLGSVIPSPFRWVTKIFEIIINLA